MACRVSALLPVLALAALASGQRPSEQQLARSNPALHRLNDRVIATAFSGRNEVVCTYCLFQVVAAAFQLGNELVRREIKDALGSPQPQQLSEVLLETSQRRPTLTGTLTGYYQRGALSGCERRPGPRCAAINALLNRRAAPVDFAARSTLQRINSEVERATDGEIKNLFAQLPSNTRLVFASTLVFSDQWQTRLSSIAGQFRPAGATAPVAVPMLVREEPLAVLDGSRDGVVGVALPYRDPAVQLYCFTTTDDTDIRDQLYQQHFLDLSAAGTRFTQVRMPKFDIVSKKYSYVDLVQLMGMREMFQAGLGPADRLKVDQLVHKAIIQTDENGTKAAGAAAIAFVPLSATPRPFNIIFDKPFICSLFDTVLEQPLFTAYIADPRNQ